MPPVRGLGLHIKLFSNIQSKDFFPDINLLYSPITTVTSVSEVIAFFFSQFYLQTQLRSFALCLD